MQYTQYIHTYISDRHATESPSQRQTAAQAAHELDPATQAPSAVSGGPGGGDVAFSHRKIDDDYDDE